MHTLRESLDQLKLAIDSMNLPARKGLVAMRDRALAIGAELSFESVPGQTTLAILLP